MLVHLRQQTNALRSLVYFFIYTVRVKGMSFGFGALFRAVGKGVSAVKGLFKKNDSKSEGQNAA